MTDQMLDDAAHDILAQLPDTPPEKPMTFTAKDRKRGLQVVLTVAAFKPMTIDPSVLAQIKAMEWPNEVVNLAPAK